MQIIRDGQGQPRSMKVCLGQICQDSSGYENQEKEPDQPRDGDEASQAAQQLNSTATLLNALSPQMGETANRQSPIASVQKLNPLC